MRIGLQDLLLGVAHPSGDGTVVHALGKQIGDAGMLETVDLDVGEPGSMAFFASVREVEKASEAKASKRREDKVILLLFKERT